MDFYQFICVKMHDFCVNAIPVSNMEKSILNMPTKWNNSFRPFATNNHMVQNLPCWRASSLLFPHWDIKTKASQA